MMRLAMGAALGALMAAAPATAGLKTYTISGIGVGSANTTTDGTNRIDLDNYADPTPGGTTKSWAQTSLGVNKIYTTSTGLKAGEQNSDLSNYVSSVWGENFTVDASASGPVIIRFKLGIDGTVNNTTGSTAFNYYFKALRGEITNNPSPRLEDISIGQTYNGIEREVALDGDNTVSIYTPNGMGYVNDYRGANQQGGYFQVFYPQFRQNPNGAGPVYQMTLRNYDDHVERSVNGGPFTRVPNSDGSAYANQVANFFVLASDTLCPLQDGDEGGCFNGVFGTPSNKRELSLEFTLNPGDKFFVVGGLMVEDLQVGTIDFGSTASLQEVVAYSLDANNRQVAVNVVSDGGTIRANAASPFVAALPEPATWGMMLVGFGGIGSVMRRCRSGRTAIA